MNTKININDYTSNQHPGKFEGEPPETEYFYEQMMDGCGETIYSEDELNDDMLYPQAEIFTVSAEEAEAFDLAVGAIFMIREDSQGFVYGTLHPHRAQAETVFRKWLGLARRACDEVFGPEDSK